MIAFGPNRRELFRRQAVTSCVGEEAIDDTSHVAHVKCTRRNVGRTRVPLCFSQIRGQLAYTFPDLEKDVRHRLQERRNTLDWTALPPLCIRHYLLAFDFCVAGTCCRHVR